jgi:hypothetical protein
MTLMVDDDGGSPAAQPRRVGRSRGPDDGPHCGATKLSEPGGRAKMSPYQEERLAPAECS